jgi:uncharacterized 2Fe-2S/4Fe-4S cluster protein (DUF4445 family)
MRDTEVLVRFRPWNAEAYVLPGTRLVEAAAEAGIVLDAPCGGEGLCGKCRVLVAAGGGEPTPIEREQLSADELRAGWRLACQSEVRGPTEVVVPPPSAKLQIDVEAETEKGSELFSASTALPDPPVQKRYVELPPPARGDDLPDLLRLERAIGGETLEIDLPLLRQISGRLREADFRGTAVLADGRLLDFEPGNTVADAFAVALDLGTTTLVAELLDLGVGARWAVEARLNPQIRFGDDVLSRILYARQTPDGLRQLQETVASAVDEMIGELCRQAGIARDRIYELAVSGNTTMQQLLCGVDTSPLGEVPFVPAGGRGLPCLARELGINIHPRGAAYVMPVIGGFVGGDTVAGILATGMFGGADIAPRRVLGGADIPVCPASSVAPGRQECLPHLGKSVPAEAHGPMLLVDIGTNGEIVLLADGKLSAASTAAGPAFEGARISCGMRGCSGAIEKAVVEGGRLLINVIGNVPPTGLCGSGLIDAAAELLRHGIVTPQGRLLTPDQLPPGVSAELADRVILHDGQVSFLLAAKGETADGRPIALTQRDLRELQLATGAIRAGIVILLRRAGLEPSDLDRVLIGGGFGNFIRRSNAQQIGLLPCKIEHHRIRYMGNTSLAGARLAALSRRAREMAEGLARRTEHVDLSCDAEFHCEFAEAMIFPEA